MGRLRLPFFILAVFCLVVAVGLEIGSGFLLSGGGVNDKFLAVIVESGLLTALADVDDGGDPEQPPGMSSRYLALVDGLLLFTTLMFTAGMVLPTRLYGRLQGIVTLIFSIVWLIMSLVLALVAFVLLMLMIGLFVSAQFGTIVYLAEWGFFPVGEAALVLGLILLLKLGFGGLLMAAQPRFLQNKGLVALFVTSIVLQLILSFLHGLVPFVVVSIVDTLWAIVIAIVALVWAIVFLIGAIIGVVNAIRVSTSVS